MNKPSRAQELFIRRLKIRRITVYAARILILAGFLFLWEFCADTGVIDSFIFSSPSKIAACFREMVRDRSIFRHISITLYETLASFLLVTLFSLLAAILLWCSKRLSDGTLSCSPEQSAEISAGPAADCLAGRYAKNNYCGRHVSCHIRKHHESVYKFHNCR
mgnify:CR=1 FL=1